MSLNPGTGSDRLCESSQAIQGNLFEVISSPTETHLTNTSFSGDFEDLIRKVPN